MPWQRWTATAPCRASPASWPMCLPRYTVGVDGDCGKCTVSPPAGKWSPMTTCGLNAVCRSPGWSPTHSFTGPLSAGPAIHRRSRCEKLCVLQLRIFSKIRHIAMDSWFGLVLQAWAVQWETGSQRTRFSSLTRRGGRRLEAMPVE